MGMMLGLYTAPPSSGGSLLLDATPYLTALTCATDEHGFESLSGSLDRALSEILRYYSQGVLYAALIKDGAIIWEGRTEDPSLHAGDQGSGLGIQALGAWRAFSDDTHTALWSTTDISTWKPMPPEVPTTGLNAREPARFQFNIDNRLFISPQKNATYANAGADNVIGALYYQIAARTTRNPGAQGGIQFDYEMLLPVNWIATLTIHNSAGTIIATSWTLNATAALQTGSIHLNALTGNPVLFVFSIRYNAAALAHANETGATYLKITNLRITTEDTYRVNTSWSAPVGPVTGAQTVTPASMAGIYVGQRLFIRQGAATNAESVIVTAITSTTFTATFAKSQGAGVTIQAHQIYADDIAAGLVAQISALNSAQLSSSVALIQSPGLDLTDEVYEDASPIDILTHLAGLGDNQTPPRRWETGVYEGRVLFFRPQNSAGRVWYVDATDLSVQRTIDDLANIAYATYSDASGRRLVTANASDSASISRYGINRVAKVDAQTTSATQAGAIRDAALNDHKDPKPRASIHFEAIYDAYGARYPLWLVRAGDTITIRNIPPSLSTSIDRVRMFRVTHTSYNVLTDVLDVEPEAPPPTLEVMLARRAEGIGV